MAEWNGLETVERTLPTAWYSDEAQYRLELDRLWGRHWVYLGRAADLAEPLDYKVFTLGRQEIVLLRDEHGLLRAFHNSCRHRGSVLCRESEGRLRTAKLVCPYHSWSYDLRGTLLRTPSPNGPAFRLEDFPLYGVALQDWNGLVFVCLADTPPPFAAAFDSPPGILDNWRMAGLATGHRSTAIVDCNWKVFWENFSECLHCPTAHPTLCDLVPIYGRSLMEPEDERNWRRHEARPEALYRGGLKSGAKTWSSDGNRLGPPLAGLTEQERARGHLFVTSHPSVYVVAHIDHVRIVRVRPLGAERTELQAEWLYPAETLTQPGFDAASAARFAQQVLDEDAALCALNQRGLRSRRHEAGVLMPEEHIVHQFHQWVRSAVGAA